MGMATGIAAIGSVGSEKLTYIQIDDSFDPRPRRARPASSSRRTRSIFSAARREGRPRLRRPPSPKVPFIVMANVVVPGEGAQWSITVPQEPLLMVTADVEAMKKAGDKTVASSALPMPGATSSTTRL